MFYTLPPAVPEGNVAHQIGGHANWKVQDGRYMGKFLNGKNFIFETFWNK